MHSDAERILFICSPSKTLHSFEEVLLDKFVSPMTAGTLQDAEPILVRAPLALIVCASELIDGTYRDLLQMLYRVRRSVPVMVVSLRALEEECKEARRLGAADCVPRPVTLGDVQTIVDKALEVISRTREMA